MMETGEKLENRIKRPVFVFGCNNSGTTILQLALRDHAGLSGPDFEGQDLDGLPDSMKQYLTRDTFRLWAHPKFKLCHHFTEEDYDEEDRSRIIDSYQDYLVAGTRLIIKSPPDLLRARLIQAYFPDAYFVAIVRNGYAVSEGTVRKRKSDPDRPQFERSHTTIDEAAEQWFRTNTIIVSHKDYLERYKIIKYEDLVENPRETLHSVLEFCDLAKTDFPILEFDKDDNEKQIARLSSYEIEVITRIAQPMLIHFGYEVLQKELKW